jgi:hypothetical protein
MRQFFLLTVMTAPAGMGAAWAGTNVWTSLGPDGGDARSLVVDPNTSSTLYALTSAGLYKSTDGGAGWSVTPPLPPNAGVTASCQIAVSIDAFQTFSPRLGRQRAATPTERKPG